jgi:hypothetical protein
MDGLEHHSPPDGKWLEAEDGRQYFLTRLKKVKGSYTRISKHEIKYGRFHHLEVDHEDDEWFYIRYYKVEPADVPTAEEVRRSQEEATAKIRESYRFDDVQVDRVDFTPYDQGLPRRGQWRQGLEIADMNGDGFLDIVHGPPRKGDTSPQIFLGDGQGSWRLWSEASWPGTALDYGDIGVGDIDGDGRLDLALGIHLRGMQVLLQKAPGRFVDASEGLPFDVPGRGGDASGFSSRAVEVVDWNGDGRLDVVALGEGPRQTQTVDSKGNRMTRSIAFGLVVFLNEGEKGWRSLSPGAAGGVFGDAFAITDLNGDQRPDAATVSYNHGMRDLLHLNDPEVATGWTTQVLDTIRPASWVFGITSGDFDGDGRSDLVTSFASHDGDTQRRGLELSRRNAAGVWETRLIAAYEGKDTLFSLAAGDVDGDGRLDLVASSTWGNVLVFLGDGAGGFVREKAPELDAPVLCRGYGLELADLDRDGKAEIVASFAGEGATILEFLGTDACTSGGALRVWRPVARPVT